MSLPERHYCDDAVDWTESVHVGGDIIQTTKPPVYNFSSFIDSLQTPPNVKLPALDTVQERKTIRRKVSVTQLGTRSSAPRQLYTFTRIYSPPFISGLSLHVHSTPLPFPPTLISQTQCPASSLAYLLSILPLVLSLLASSSQLCTCTFIHALSRADQPIA